MRQILIDAMPWWAIMLTALAVGYALRWAYRVGYNEGLDRGDKALRNT